MNEEHNAVTLEDLHGEIFPEEAAELHEQKHCELFGYHRYGCPSRTFKDSQLEFRADLDIMAANGK